MNTKKQFLSFLLLFTISTHNILIYADDAKDTWIKAGGAALFTATMGAHILWTKHQIASKKANSSNSNDHQTSSNKNRHNIPSTMSTPPGNPNGTTNYQSPLGQLLIDNKPYWKEEDYRKVNQNQVLHRWLCLAVRLQNLVVATVQALLLLAAHRFASSCPHSVCYPILI